MVAAATFKSDDTFLFIVNSGAGVKPGDSYEVFSIPVIPLHVHIHLWYGATATLGWVAFKRKYLFSHVRETYKFNLIQLYFNYCIKVAHEK